MATRAPARAKRETRRMIDGSSLARLNRVARDVTGPAEYFERALAAAAAACERPQAIERRINLGGGRRGILHFCDGALEKLLFPALAHQELPKQKIKEDFKILAWDSLHSGIPMWPPAWTIGDYLARGEIAGYNNERYRAVFRFDSGILSLYDAHRQIGLWWTQDYAQIASYEHAAPFLLLFHWWYALGCDRSFLLHAAAVGTEDRGGLLLAGRGGSGKSTTALASLLDGRWLYVADDYCVVLEEREGATVHSLYCSAKLDAKTLAGFPGLSRSASSLDGWRDPQEKIILNLHRSFSKRLRRELPLRAILLPSIPKESNGEGPSRFTPVGSGAAVRALAPSTLFQLPGAGANNFRMIAALTNRLPCFQVELGGEFAGVPASLREFMKRLPSRWDKFESV
jgi:hypothetical protein